MQEFCTEDNDKMRATLVEVIDGNPEMMCSLSFDRCEETLAALQKESPPLVKPRNSNTSVASTPLP